MGRFKRIVALALSTVVTVSSALSVFADELSDIRKFTDIDYNTNVGRAVERLVGLGIIDGYEEDDKTFTFQPNGIIKRSEFAKIMIFRDYGLKSVSDMMEDGTPSGFEDVDYNASGEAKPHWSQKYVKLAADAGIINGYEEDGKKLFKPEEPVKYCEAVTMLCRALGYGGLADEEMAKQEEAGNTVPWFYGMMTVASRMRLLERADVVGDQDPAPRSLIAVLTSNACDAITYEQNAAGNYVAVSPSGGQITGQSKTEVRGILMGVAQHSIIDSPVGSNYVVIKVGSNYESYYLHDSARYADYVGYQVVGFAEKIDSEIGFTSLSKGTNNKLTTVPVHMLYEDQTSGSRLEYYVDEDKYSRGATEISNTAKVILNGRYYNIDPSQIVNFIKSEVKMGTIDLLSNNGDSSADVVDIKSYTTFAVVNSSLNDPYKRIFARVYPRDLYGDLLEPGKLTTYMDVLVRGDSRNDIKFLNPSGNEIAHTDVQAWSIVSIMRSRDDGEKIVTRVIISNDKVTGDITEYDRTNKRIILQGKTYEFSENYLAYDEDNSRIETNSSPKLSDLAVGSRVTARLDFQGRIAAIEPLTSEASNFKAAILKDAAFTSSGTSGNALQLKVQTTTGEVILTCADKVQVDRGASVGGVTYPVYYDCKSSSTVSNSDPKVGLLTYLKEVASKSTLNKDVTGNKGYVQLIRYSVSSSSGKVNMLDTLMDEPASNSDELILATELNDVSSPYTFNSSANSFTSPTGNNILVNSSTAIFYIPPDRSRDELYSVRSISNFMNESKYHIEAYNRTGNVAKYVIQYRENSDYNYTTDSNYFLVSRATQTSANGSNFTQLTGYRINQNKAESTTINCDESLSNISLVAGDVISYTVNQTGALKSYHLIVSAAKMTGTGDDPMSTLGSITVEDGETVLAAAVRAAKDLRVLSDNSNQTYDEYGNVNRPLAVMEGKETGNAKKFTMVGTVTDRVVNGSSLSSIQVSALLSGDKDASNAPFLTSDGIKSSNPDPFPTYGIFNIPCNTSTVVVKYSVTGSTPTIAKVDDANELGYASIDPSSADKVFIFASNNLCKLVYVIGR